MLKREIEHSTLNTRDTTDCMETLTTITMMMTGGREAIVQQVRFDENKC